MYVLGMFEFKEYLQASHYLEEARREYRLFTVRGYADVYPTRIHYDYGQEKMFKESLNIENYVIWLIESKEILEKDITFWQRRMDAFNKAFQTLSPSEQEICCLFQEGKKQSRLKIEPVLKKLKAELELLIDASFELKAKSLEDDSEFDVDEDKPAEVAHELLA